MLNAKGVPRLERKKRYPVSYNLWWQSRGNNIDYSVVELLNCFSVEGGGGRDDGQGRYVEDVKIRRRR